MAKKGKKIVEEPEPATVAERVAEAVEGPEPVAVHVYDRGAGDFRDVPVSATDETKTTDERVAAVFSAPEPVETVEPTAAEAWHLEAGEILELARTGTPVSPARVVACVRSAVGLVPR